MTAIVTYHCGRVFSFWVDAIPALQSEGTGDYVASRTGAQCNDAYRYVVWWQKAPWHLIELISVMKLTRVVMESKGLIVIAGLMSAIAICHYLRILNSGVDAYSAVQSKGASNYVVSLTGAQVNDAFRYVLAWLLIELILVMKPPRGVTVLKGRSIITALVTAIATYHCVRIFNVCSPCQRSALGATARRGGEAVPASGRRWEPPRGGEESP